ncbi:MAG: class I SAM-dependent methyltransferase [Mycobacteriales bacterium]|nr:methyltransferase domain-containing protein [Frankia sp.]
MTALETTATVDEEAVGALAGRIFEAGVGAMELVNVHLGRDLGLYAALRDHGPLTPGDLAKRIGIDERYAREWLEQQVIAGFLEVADATEQPDARSFRLPPVSEQVLANELSPAYLAPFGAFVVSLGAAYPKVAQAYRSGGGVSFGEYGDVLRAAQEALNRPAYENFLAGWIENGLPDVHERLSSGAQAQIADIGCGGGWSTINLAKVYPSARVVGLDNDKPSIKQARTNAKAAGVDNVEFTASDSADPELKGRYDLVCILEALHDMPQPVQALTAARNLLAPGGAILVMDERVADEFGAVGDPIERMMYSASAIHCLLVSRSDGKSQGTGAVFRTSILESYAEQAGLRVTVLPIEHDCWRFYRLDA